MTNFKKPQLKVQSVLFKAGHLVAMFHDETIQSMSIDHYNIQPFIRDNYPNIYEACKTEDVDDYTTSSGGQVAIHRVFDFEVFEEYPERTHIEIVQEYLNDNYGWI